MGLKIILKAKFRNRLKLFTACLLVVIPIDVLANDITIPCDSSYVSLDGFQLAVRSTGSDDTDNIQCALNTAADNDISKIQLLDRSYSVGALEITSFKGLGEISPSEFKNFIGDEIRLEPIILNRKSKINDLLSFYMGKNTQERQEFIIDKLRVEKDLIDVEE